MKIRNLVEILHQLDPDLEVITIMNPSGERRTIETIEEGHFDGEKFVPSAENTDREVNAVDLVWNPLP